VDVDRLGAVRSTHRVAGRTLAVVGTILIVSGIAALGTLVVLNVIAPSSVGPKSTIIETDLDGTSTGYHPGSWGFGPVLVPLGVITLVAGALAAGHAARLGPGAYLQARDRGLVWGNRRRTTGRSWEHVRWLDVPSRKPIPDHLFARLGLESRCLIVFDDGKRVAFAGNTADHAALVSDIRRHCPQAKRLPVKQRGTYRYRFAWLGGAIASAAGCAGVAWYLSTLPNEVSDSVTNTLIAILMILVICVIVGFAGYGTAGQRNDN
jgi:hypothetical protein